MDKQKTEQDIGVTAPTSRRIMAFDLVRGYFLAMIMVDHIELYPSGFDFFTGKGRLYVSAAEGFFFLSGLLVGMVYKRRIERGTAFIFRKMWTRAAELYVVSVALTLFYTWWAVASNHTGIKYGLPATIDWHWIIVHTLTFRYQYGWADFLSRFTILMLIAPFAFWLLTKGKWPLVLAASIAAWIFRDNNFIMAWQILFFGAMIVGFYWHEILARINSLKARQKRTIKRALYTAAGITFAVSYGSVYLLSLLNDHIAALPQWLENFTFHWNSFNEYSWLYAEKWTMGPLRIILFLFWATVLYMWVRKHEQKINRYTKGILELLGQNSLFVYGLHSFITFGFKFFIPAKTNFLINFGITLMALLALVWGTMAYKAARLNWPHVSMTSFYRYLHRKSRALIGFFA